MNRERIKSYAAVANFGRHVELSFFTESIDGRSHVAKPVVMEELPVGSAYVQPTVLLGMADAQSLIDELWKCGLRPTEGSGSAGSLAATERHLRDMQRIVFKDFDQGEKHD